MKNRDNLLQNFSFFFLHARPMFKNQDLQEAFMESLLQSYRSRSWSNKTIATT